MFKINAEVLRVFPIKKANGQFGVTKFQDVLVTFKDDNDNWNELCLTCGHERVNDLEKLKMDDEVDIDFAIRSKEYNGKWYSNATVLKISKKKNSRSKKVKAVTETIDAGITDPEFK